MTILQSNLNNLDLQAFTSDHEVNKHDQHKTISDHPLHRHPQPETITQHYYLFGHPISHSAAPCKLSRYLRHLYCLFIHSKSHLLLLCFYLSFSDHQIFIITSGNTYIPIDSFRYVIQAKCQLKRLHPR